MVDFSVRKNKTDITQIAVCGLTGVSLLGLVLAWIGTPVLIDLTTATINLARTPFSLIQYLTGSLVAIVISAAFPSALGVILLGSAAAAFLISGVGELQTAAVLWYAGAIFLSGRFIASRVHREKIAGLPELAWIYGLAVYISVFSVLVHFRINYRYVDGLIVSIPYLWAAQILRARRTFRFQLPRINNKTYWAFALFTIAFVWCAAAAFVPSVAFDDMSFHRLLWTQLDFYHAALFDVRSQIWSVAPFGADLLFDIPTHIVGRDMRGAVDLGLLTLLCWASWRMFRWTGATKAVRLVVLAVIVSTPIIVLLMTSRQVELVGMVVAVIFASLIFRLRRASWIDVVLVGTTLVMVCASLKLTFIILAVCGGAAFMFVRLRYRGQYVIGTSVSRWAVCSVLIVVFVAGLHPYVYAYLKTGNPVFPLYNAIFKSTYYAQENFSPEIYAHRRSLAGFADMFWHTSRYLESDDFVSGFQFISSVSIGFVVMLFAGRRAAATRVMFAVACAFIFIVFCATQYYRYIAPVIPMLCTPVVLLFSPYTMRRTALGVSRNLLVLMLSVAVLAANMLVSPGVMYYLKPGWLQMWAAVGKSDLIVSVSPESIFNERLSHNMHGEASVLYDGTRPFSASLWGRAFVQTYFMPAVSSALRTAETPKAFRTLVSKWGVDYVYWDVERIYDGHDFYLRRAGPLVEDYGMPVDRIGRIILIRLMPESLVASGIADFDPPLTPDFSFATQQTTGVSSVASLMVSADAVATRAISLGTAQAVRYEAEFTCRSKDDYFVAQINWSGHDPYYRLVACTGTRQSFAENIFVPNHAVKGVVYLSTRKQSGAEVFRLRLSRLEPRP